MTSPRLSDLLALALLTLSVLFVLGGALYGTPSSSVLSAVDADARLLFVPWRSMTATALAAGELPLWNPHVFNGAPFHGGFQAALLYPPTWLCAILPTATALNIEFGFHLWLAGFLMYLWARRRGCDAPGSLAAALIAIFGGPHYWQLYAGHLPHLAAMSWSPAVLMACDELCDRPSIRWWIAGALAATAQLLAGFPQFVYYTAIGAQLLVLLRWASADQRRASMLIWPATLYLASAGLGAAQLLPGLAAAEESVRSLGVSRSFASSFSLPPESLLGAVAPGLFGLGPDDYWGRWLPWDSSAYVGAGAIALALIGMRSAGRAAKAEAVLCGVFVVIALGRYTPVFNWLYDYLPVFDSFRAPARALWISQLMLALIAARGLSSIREAGGSGWGEGRRGVAVGLALTGTLLAGLCALSDQQFSGAIERLAGDRDVMWDAAMLQRPAAQAHIAQAMRTALGYAAFGLWSSALLLTLARSRWAAGGLLLLVAFELIGFARLRTPHCDLSSARLGPAATRLIDERPARVLWLDPLHNNLGASSGHLSAWGYGPDATARCARLMHYAQTGEIAGNPEYMRLTRIDPALRPARIGWVVARQLRGFSPQLELDQGRKLYRLPQSLAPATIVDSYQVMAPGQALRYLGAARFPPERLVLLESEPALPVRPAPGASGRVLNYTRRGTDRIAIGVDLSRPSMLLVSESYATGWTARDEATGERFDVQPADVAFQAVALPKGRRTIVLEYRPAAWTIGCVVSLVSWAILALVAAISWRRRAPRLPLSQQVTEPAAA